MINIGEILKNSREDLDLTQIAVMELTGINNKTLSGYEHGISEPDLETLAKLFSLYGLSADEILEIKNNVPVQKSMKLSADEHALIKLFRKLDKQHKEDALKIVKAFSEK